MSRGGSSKEGNTDTRPRETCAAPRVEEHALESGLCGFWYAPWRLIVLDDRLTPTQRRCTLCHELVHAKYDDPACDGPDGGKLEWRARRETALQLIDPIAYATAEEIWNGDPWGMACELDVTMQVLADYRTIVHDAMPFGMLAGVIPE